MPTMVCHLQMELLNNQKILDKTEDIPLLMQSNRLDQDVLVESELSLKMPKMSAP